MQEEISLREILEVLINGKWIIALITSVAMLMTALYSYIVLSPEYEATSTVRVEMQSEVLDQQSFLKPFSETLKSDVAMNRIIDKLHLDRKRYSINSIRNSIRIELVENTNVMRLKVIGNETAVITNISNLLAFELGARIEISDRSKRIVESRKRLTELENEVAVATSDLDEARYQLEKTPKLLVVKQSLANSPYLQSVLKDTSSVSNEELGTLQLETESINPLYTTLLQRISETTIELTKKQTEKENVLNEIAENESKILELENQIVQEKLRAVNSERLLNGFNAVFISPSIEPTVPIGPRKFIFVLLAALVGLTFSILIVFTRHYWNTTKVNGTRN